MKSRKSIAPVIMMLMVSAFININFAFSQHPVSKKTLRLYNEAINLFQLDKVDAALLSVNKCLDSDSLFSDALVLKGDIFCALNNQSNAANCYISSIVLDSSKSKLYMNAGRLFLSCGEYVNAIDALQKYSYKFCPKGKYCSFVDSLINASTMAQYYVDNAYGVDNIFVDTIINSIDNEYINAISSDNDIILFTRRHYVNNIVNEDIFMAKRFENHSNYDTVCQLSDIVTLDGNEGAVTISPDGNAMFFTACGRQDGYGSCDIYFSKRISDEKWSKPVNLGPAVNTSYWETQPCMSPDGRTLFFVSNRPGGYGKSDIWYCELNDNGLFSKAKNCGEIINTEFDDLAPFIHFDGVTMFFSSDRPGGLGGLDLYKYIINYDTIPVNFGYPLNDYRDQMNFVVDPAGITGYISSISDEGDYDIISFDLPLSLRPVPSFCLHGIVVDGNDNIPIVYASIDLTDKNAGRLYSSINSYSDGEFTLCLQQSGRYGLTVNANGYMIFSDLFDLDKYFTDTIVVELFPIEVGKDMIIRNVEFEYNSFALKDESLPELARIVKMMMSNDELIFEIRGHTDDTGTKEYNYKLSENRAKTVYDYLVNSGIAVSRLTYRGYGSDIPIATNATEEGRGLNRRTEIRVIKKM